MFDLLKEVVDLFRHLDVHLGELIKNYGALTYLILFLVIFAETGLVIIPFLPGDSLLFAAGMAATFGDLNPWMLIALLIIAAVLGDTVNYHIGKFIGPKVFREDNVQKNFFLRLLKKEHLEKAQGFYETHGGKTIIMARFVPIVRTFAPFVAGVGNMNYSRFISYNVIGGIIWVTGLILAGYYLARFDFVKEHFEHIVLGIIGISVVPIVIEYLRAKKN
ncbi:MAG: DedA family protein [Cytophagales bacterium]|nr:DedA family protein [Cytophaga sp.]